MTLESARARGYLTPTETWGKPFSGSAEWVPAPWLRRVNPPGTWHYKTETTWLDGENFFIMHDTSTFSDGHIEFRDAVAKQIAPDRVRVTYDGVEAGMDIKLREDGFVTTYRYLTVLAPKLSKRPVYADVVDDNYVGTAGVATQRGLKGFEHLDPATPVMHDTLSLKWKGRPVGDLILRLTHEDEPVA